MKAEGQGAGGKKSYENVVVPGGKIEKRLTQSHGRDPFAGIRTSKNIV